MKAFFCTFLKGFKHLHDKFQKFKLMKKYSLLIAISLLIGMQASCQSTNDKKEETIAQEVKPIEVPIQNGMSRAYFASGCFWCVEAVYESVKGVKESISGYSGGHTEKPTYRSSNTGRTGHAEAVEIIYNPNTVSFSQLVDVYFGSQNITQVNGQGPDHGSQYRSIIFYQNLAQKQIIDEKIAELEKEVGEGKVAAEVKPFQKFWKGEAYHQNYEKNNPYNSYIIGVSLPRLIKFQQKFPELLKEEGKH